MQRQRSLFHVQEGNSDVTRSCASYHSKKDTNYAGKFPEEFHAAEYTARSN